MNTNATFAKILLSIVFLLLELFSISATDGKLLIIIIVLAILLLITLVIIAYLVCKIKSNRVKSSTAEVKHDTKNDESNPKPHIYDTPTNRYQNPENEQATYTDLKVPGQRNDGHMYGHLNHQPHIYANTAI